MSTTLFRWFYSLCQSARRHQENCETFKKKAIWAFIEGFGKAGIYWFS